MMRKGTTRREREEPTRREREPQGDKGNHRKGKEPQGEREQQGW